MLLAGHVTPVLLDRQVAARGGNPALAEKHFSLKFKLKGQRK
jgi:hypothetical protein